MVKFLETLEEFHSAVEESKEKLVVFDFTASWCPPCKAISPKIDALAEEETDGKYPKARFLMTCCHATPALLYEILGQFDHLT